MKRRVASGKGKEYSNVSREVEANFRNWLQVSSLNEKVFTYLIDSEEFALKLQKDSEQAVATLYRKSVPVGSDVEDVPIGLPFIWQKESGIERKDYMVDLGLLLMHMEGKCKNERSKKKIIDFVKNEVRL